jgi:hypothetical protein
MAIGNIKGISISNKENRSNFLKKISESPYIEKLVENNRGFYIKVSKPVISLVPDRSNVRSPVPVPVVISNDVVGDIHYDEDIVIMPQQSAFFHNFVEQYPKILELKNNN